MTAPFAQLMAPPSEIKMAARLYKIMAFVVGIGLLMLVAHMIMKYGLKMENNPLAWWPTPHGYLYAIYIAATFYLGLKVRWPIQRTIGVMLMGLVPFLSFVAERRVAKEIDGILARHL